MDELVRNNLPYLAQKTIEGGGGTSSRGLDTFGPNSISVSACMKRPGLKSGTSLTRWTLLHV
jgi:hypothetical protein